MDGNEKISAPGRASLIEVLEVLHHPDFYWLTMNGLTCCKYLNLRVDTRDNRCWITDRDNRPIDLKTIKEHLKGARKGMNSNPAIVVNLIT